MTNSELVDGTDNKVLCQNCDCDLAGYYFPDAETLGWFCPECQEAIELSLVSELERDAAQARTPREGNITG